MQRLLVAVCAALAGAPTGAFAAPNCGALLEQGCACAVPIDSVQDGAIGQLSEIQGSVLVSGASGYKPIASIVPLDVGASVIVPSDGRALLTVGRECSRELPPESNTVIREKDGCACAVQVEANIDVETTTGQVGAGLGIAALLSGGGIVTFFALQTAGSVSP